MGKQARLRGLRRWLRGQADVPAEVADSVDRRVRGRSSHGDMRYGRGSAMAASEQDPRAYQSIKPEDANNFHVGMRVSGPPEAFGLPPSEPLPPGPPVTVTAVDAERGVITLTTKAD